MSSLQNLSTDAKHSLYGTSAFNKAGEAIMSFAPINAIHQHLCAFHYYAHDRTRQIEAHHFCHHWSKDLHQCVIYDSDEPNARLIGVEYIISENVFKTLNEQEKRYWHSHRYETKNIIPNVVNDIAEQPAMLELQTTYGKTVHTWQPDIHPDIPLGAPNLMMSFTAPTPTSPSGINPSQLHARDAKLGVSTEAKRDLRAGYLPNYGFSVDGEGEGKEVGCDEGERRGKCLQFIAEERAVKT